MWSRNAKASEHGLDVIAGGSADDHANFVDFRRMIGWW